MTNTRRFAERELDILAQTTPDAIILPFRQEILNLYKAFGESGQSGGSAPCTAHAISEALRLLLLQEPLTPITGDESEWYRPIGHDQALQNKRCSALFKDAKDARPYYVSAIHWQEEDGCCYTGKAYANLEALKLVGSAQYVRLPFMPKTFYIEVVKVSVSKEETELKDLHYTENKDGSCYISVIKDLKHLEEVFAHYDEMPCLP